jgi:natural product precursor
MKRKPLEKKLALKKRTVTNLENKELKEVQGGATLSCNCNTDYCTVYISNCAQCNTVLCH